MKKLFYLIIFVSLSVCASAAKRTTAQLVFNPLNGVQRNIVMPTGEKIGYTAYENLYFVTNVEDSDYQFMNVFIPDDVKTDAPILIRTYIGGYMQSAAGQPQTDDASGRALKEGLVLVIPGSRGRGSMVLDNKDIKNFNGRAPAGLLDLKAAIRYLRYFDKDMPGNAERIIIDGTSAGGAMSSLVGATGNNPVYEPYLKAMGAADTRDDVFASVCFCPITDLDHADMAYEWLYGCTDSRKSKVSEEQKKVSEELAKQYPSYINSLNLQKKDGTEITADNYLDYIKSFIIQSAQTAKNNGADIPDSIGFKFSSNGGFGMPQINGNDKGGMLRFHGHGPQLPPRGMMGLQKGEYVTDLDMTKYLNYVVTTQPLKSVPAFDAMDVAGDEATGENEEFGNKSGNSVNFTDYSLQKATGKTAVTVSPKIKELVRIMNPMNFIGAENTTVAPHWYIRHGSRDRDTAFGVSINLATKLQNCGYDVDFLLAWNRPHSGDYNLDDMFKWIKNVTRQ